MARLRVLLIVLASVPFSLALPGAASAQLRPYVFKPPVLTATPTSTPTPTPAPTPPPRKELPIAFRLLCNYLGQNRPEGRIPDDLRTLVATVNQQTISQLAQVGTAAHLDLSYVGSYNDVDSDAMDNRTVWAVGSCASIAAWQSSELAPDSATNSADNHRALVELDFYMTRAERWLGIAVAQAQQHSNPKTPSVVTEARSRVEDAGTSLAAEMRAHNLLNAFSAGFFVGTAIGTTNRVVGTSSSTDVTQRIVETDSTLQLTTLTVESAHFGWRGEHRADVSFRAQAGFRPVLNLLSASFGPGSDQSAMVAILQQALVVSGGARFGRPFEIANIELSGVVQVGAAQVSSDAVTFDDKKPALIATSVTPGTSRAAWFSDYGAELNFFDNPVRVLHAEKGLVTPAVSVDAGYRYDSRFASANFPGLGTSPHRFYFRCMVDAIKTISSRAIGEDGKAFDIGFGIEYERPMFGTSSSVPASTRFLIRGDINLLKASGGDNKAPAKKTSS